MTIDLLKAEYLSLLDKRHTLILAIFTTMSASLFSAIAPFMDLIGNNAVTVFLKGILAPWAFFLMLAIYFLTELTRMEGRLFTIEEQLNSMLNCGNAFNAFSHFSNPLAVNFKVVLLPTVSFAAALFISMHWENSQLSRFFAISIVGIACLLIPYLEYRSFSKKNSNSTTYASHNKVTPSTLEGITKGMTSTKANMLAHSIRIKKSISKVSISKLIQDDIKQRVEWLLQEYDRRSKEILEIEKISAAVLPASVGLSGLLINCFSNEGFDLRLKIIATLSVTAVLFCILGLIIDEDYVMRKKYLVSIEKELEEYIAPSPFVYYRQLKKPLLRKLLSYKITPLLLIVVTGIAIYKYELLNIVYPPENPMEIYPIISGVFSLFVLILMSVYENAPCSKWKN